MIQTQLIILKKIEAIYMVELLGHFQQSNNASKFWFGVRTLATNFDFTKSIPVTCNII